MMDPPSSAWIQIGLCALWLGLVFGVAEWLRGRQVGGELVRKFVHIGVGNIILLAWFLQIPRLTGILFSVLFSVLVLLSYQVKILESLNGVGRRSFGTFFYAVSMGLLLTFFWYPGIQPFAVIGVLVMTWGDALAALVGQTWGRHRLGSLRKTWEGSLTMWAVSSGVVFLVMMAVAGGSWDWVLGSLAIGLVATGLEMVSWGGLDNLTVPLGSAVLSYWLFNALL